MIVCEKLLILGAGAEKSLGMPLASELLPGMIDFSENEGKEICDCIKSALPKMRFNLSKFRKDAINSILNSSDSNLKRIQEEVKKSVSSVKEGLNNYEKIVKRSELIINLLEKVIAFRDSAKIDDNTEGLIINSFDDINEINDDFILELEKASFSEIFKVVLNKLISKELEFEPVSNVFREKMLDIEELLIKTFSGFYTNNEPDIKKYVYVSWLLWAFLLSKRNTSNEKDDSSINSLYTKIDNKFNIITFNYTDYVESISNVPQKQCLHFHGSLNKYLRVDTKDELEIPASLFDNKSILDFLQNNLNEKNMNFKEGKYLIPNIVPPMKIKPVISSNFLDVWHDAKNLIKDSKEITIVGYSFNYADEHFNDIFRKSENKQFINIIDPNADFIKSRISKIIGYEESNFTEQKIDGRKNWRFNNITITNSYAEDLDFS